ncbi:hypothetical protein LOAG_04452 [Loa loa]|uniref:Uncharacterized protein n=1 Tax=Loa loa TaxID=7209 RepID=A0A1S0U2W0_LOALO|nr:hypothetical protein LOAG_04452 [Loa loa]EFO24027.1 hypothetical protein LOAG_04452 [Loa loa]
MKCKRERKEQSLKTFETAGLCDDSLTKCYHLGSSKNDIVLQIGFTGKKGYKVTRRSQVIGSTDKIIDSTEKRNCVKISAKINNVIGEYGCSIYGKKGRKLLTQSIRSLEWCATTNQFNSVKKTTTKDVAPPALVVTLVVVIAVINYLPQDTLNSALKVYIGLYVHEWGSMSQE